MSASRQLQVLRSQRLISRKAFEDLKANTSSKGSAKGRKNRRRRKPPVRVPRPPPYVQLLEDPEHGPVTGIPDSFTMTPTSKERFTRLLSGITTGSTGQVSYKMLCTPMPAGSAIQTENGCFPIQAARIGTGSADYSSSTAVKANMKNSTAYASLVDQCRVVACRYSFRYVGPRGDKLKGVVHVNKHATVGTVFENPTVSDLLDSGNTETFGVGVDFCLDLYPASTAALSFQDVYASTTEGQPSRVREELPDHGQVGYAYIEGGPSDEVLYAVECTWVVEADPRLQQSGLLRVDMTPSSSGAMDWASRYIRDHSRHVYRTIRPFIRPMLEGAVQYMTGGAASGGGSYRRYIEDVD